MLDSLMEELNITSDMISIFILIGLGLIFLFIVSAIIDLSKAKSNVDDYIMDFEKSYNATKDIKLAMQEVKDTFNPKSTEAKALKEGIDYLDTAIIKDYKVALGYVEQVYKNNDINNLHSKILEQNRVHRQLMLEGGSENGEN